MPEPVEVRVGGRTYRVVASAEHTAVERLARVVDTRLCELSGGPGRPVPPQALLLAAISLAHDLEQERARRHEVEQRARATLRAVLSRIDAALEAAPELPDPVECGAAEQSQPSAPE